MIGRLRTRVRKQPIILLYFEFETVVKFNNLGARALTRSLITGVPDPSFPKSGKSTIKVNKTSFKKWGFKHGKW